LRYSCLLVGLVLSLLLTTSLHPQAAPSGPVSSPKYRVEARTVIVDVVVTNKDGSPVSGLHQKDFAISEKGKQQTITSFTEYVGESQVPSQRPSAGPAKISKDNPDDELPGSLNVLLLDSLNTPIEDQQSVQTQAVKFLRGMHPGPRLAVFTLSTSLGLVQEFTSDPTLMQAALARASALPRTAPWLKTQSDVVIDETSLRRPEERRPAAEMQVSALSLGQYMAQHTNSFQIDVRAGLTLMQLHQLAMYLSTIPGRKNVMWFSGSFPLTIVPSQLAYNATRDYTEEVRKTAGLLATARVAVYPIAALGLKAPALYSGSTPQQEPSPSDSQRQAKMLNEDIERRFEESGTLKELAKVTGGKAFFNTNGLAEAIAAAMDHGEHFYTLTYTPANKEMNGKFRPIEVRTLQGEYQLAYRRGYYAEK
jgi:VWFA-related protein